MTSIKTIAIAAALVAGVSTIALAQSGTSGMSQPGSSTEQNAKASGGPGTHVGAPKTGTAESNAKVLHNQNGYKNDRQ
jgi:hypothetical protein